GQVGGGVGERGGQGGEVGDGDGDVASGGEAGGGEPAVADGVDDGWGDDYTKVIDVVAEPQAYADFARAAGTDPFDPAALTGTPGGPDTPVPALFSRDLAARLAAG
ncbi:hypothetical protein VM98_37830, partial [Streptomyces rubellomurinus subsp. indigoferus]